MYTVIVSTPKVSLHIAQLAVLSKIEISFTFYYDWLLWIFQHEIYFMKTLVLRLCQWAETPKHTHVCYVYDRFLPTI